MTRDIHLAMEEGEVVARCLKEKVGISAIERLPAGGVRLVCNSAGGAQTIRTKLKKQIIAEAVVRTRHRPAKPLW